MLSLTRLMALLHKEAIQMRRDRLTFGMMLGLPLVQLFLFGFAINTDPKDLPTALIDLDHGAYSRAIETALEQTHYYRFVSVDVTAAEADAMLRRGEVTFVVTIPADFGHRMQRGDHPQILVEADSTDPSAASGAISSLSTVSSQALNRLTRDQYLPPETEAAKLQIIVHRRYNPEGISQYNIVPALLGVILQLTMVMMTSMALTREIERGTMENLLSMPTTPFEIMLGKILPYLVVGAVQVIVVLVAARVIFGIPFAGSLPLLMLGIMIFVLSLVLLGYLISTLARTQMQAMQLTFFFFLPSMLLSGFMFPFRGMPIWAQVLGDLFPITYFLRLIRGVMLKGTTIAEVAGPLGALCIFVVILAGLALLRFRKTLD